MTTQEQLADAERRLESVRQLIVDTRAARRASEMQIARAIAEREIEAEVDRLKRLVNTLE